MKSDQQADHQSSRPLAPEDFDSGFAMVRKLVLQGLLAALVALVVICALEPAAIPFAIAGGVLLILFYVGGMAKLRIRMDAAKHEIEARGDRPLPKGDFSDEDDWPS